MECTVELLTRISGIGPLKLRLVPNCYILILGMEITDWMMGL